MKIRMLCDVTAAANPAGTERQRYARSQLLTAEAEWQSWMFKAFVAQNWAEIVADPAPHREQRVMAGAPEIDSQKSQDKT